MDEQLLILKRKKSLHLMKKIFFLCICLIAFALIEASANELKLKYINTEIEVDGIIDSEWMMADSITSMFQLAPFHGKEPTFPTTIKILTSTNAIYVLMICIQPADKLKAQAGKLDDYTGDIVSFMIDTFGDKRTAYKFGVSASGVMTDSRMLDDGRNRDPKWDGIWFGDAAIYDWGYVVEMKIPYRSIQYDESLREWGLDFDRWIAYKNEDLYWNKYEENEGQRISKFGRLVFEDYHPTIKGLNLEIYPVGIAKASYLNNGNTISGGSKLFDKPAADAGLDVFYNPSTKLTYQLTVNPDFAQIEADPFDFNISRYESYFDERRPFFTEGNEIFMPSGRERNSGFYRPLELFYPRRIGKKLPDGNEVPLLFGTKAFGRINDWEYGGFLALTGEKEYELDDEKITEEKAYFGSARLKKQIFNNSSIGVLFAGKKTKDNIYGVIDIDGAFRGGDWQLAYQFARSFVNNDGDYAASAGFRSFKDTWANFVRLRIVGNDFDVDQIGYVPWKGTTEFVGLTGPRWYFDEGTISAILIYFGPAIYYEHSDLYTDHSGVLGLNMQFRDNWGYEINIDYGKTKDQDKLFNSYGITLSSWYNFSTKWSGNLYGGYQRTYNFSRDYLAFYSWMGIFFSWNTFKFLELGTSYDMFIEGNPEGNIEDITFNARPYFSLTPVNNLNIRFYIDNVFVRSSDQLESLIAGLLFSYNFSPKSWIYLAFNEVQQRYEKFNLSMNSIIREMRTSNRDAVVKVKYLYYF